MNRRGAERPNLVYYFEVRSADSGRTIGRIVDLTTRGMRVICDDPAELFREYPLVLHLEQEDGAAEELRIEGRCVWVGHDVNPSLHSAGFEFRQVSPLQEALLQEVIGRYRFSHQVS